jgi:inorganic pyrophosphatase
MKYLHQKRRRIAESICTKLRLPPLDEATTGESRDNDGSMADLTTLANRLDPTKATCRAIIETPKGSRNKFDYDPESNLFLLGGLLPEGMMFPFDFGFIPSTLGDDGDPLDIMVLMDAPAHVGCLIDVRILGVIDAEQTEDGKTENNSRLLGAVVHSYEHEDLETISDVSKTLLSQVEEFFISYNRQRGKKFKIKDTGGPKKALRFLKSGIKAHQNTHKK